MYQYLKFSESFFSLGTNDLAQFLRAADGTNDRVVHYLPRAKESLLFLIENFTKVAHEECEKMSVWVNLLQKRNA